MDERFERGLLNNILDVRVTADCRPEYTEQRPEMRRDQVCEKILPTGQYLANQFDFLRGGCWDRNHSEVYAS
jgi:hypothetical protein